MYLFLPALFLLAQKVKTPWTIVLGWVVLTAVVFFWIRSGHGYNLKYVPCFIPGIIAYKLSLQKRLVWPFWGWPLLLWGALVVFMLTGTLEAAWLICLGVGIAATLFLEMRNPWLRQASHLIAKYSYGIYLTHYFSIWLAFAKLHFIWPIYQWIIFLSTVVVLPVGLYHLLEQPLMNLGKKIAERRLASSPAQAFVSRTA